MKALLYHGPRDIRYETFADPELRDPGDIIVRMEKSGICGSDLHIYHGQGFSPDLGYCVGHEAIGEVVQVGAAVSRRKPGDKVMISAAVGCARCRACLGGHVARCENGQTGCYGLGHALEGCQAEAIRVPYGDFNAALIPEGLSADQALMLTDNLPTAYYGCLNAEIRPGGTVAVVGLGPIGLMAVECALVLGASRVYALDLVAERRARAVALGATALAPASAAGEIREATRGRMADSVVEAVGADATIATALQIAGIGGTVSAIGVNLTPDFKFHMGLAFSKNLTFRIGGCSVQCHWPELIPLIREGRLHPERVISHRMPLSEGESAYRIFDGRADGALKIVLTA
jgi:threonine dehydrogenase-like Zn-dependent dehydrogenase